MSETATGNHDLPFAKELFEAADCLRGSVESAEYKHLVLGLLFLKYISDAFERRRTWLEGATRDPATADYFTEADAVRAEILEDLTVDWADHEATEAAIRAKIKRLLRRFGYVPPAGGGGRMPESVVDDILEQARVLYRFWPETLADSS